MCIKIIHGYHTATIAFNKRQYFLHIPVDTTINGNP